MNLQEQWQWSNSVLHHYSTASAEMFRNYSSLLTWSLRENSSVLYQLRVKGCFFFFPVVINWKQPRKQSQIKHLSSLTLWSSIMGKNLNKLVSANTDSWIGRHATRSNMLLPLQHSKVWPASTSVSTICTCRKLFLCPTLHAIVKQSCYKL